MVDSGNPPVFSRRRHQFIQAYETDPVQTIKELTRAKKAEANRNAVRAAMIDYPDATQEQIADMVGLDQSTVSRVMREICTTAEPKLLKHGGKHRDKGSHANVKRGANKEYVTARLRRDAETDTKARAMLDTLEAGDISARQAAIQMGYIKPADPARIVHQQREKLEPAEQVAVWREWGRALPDDAMDRFSVAQEAFNNLYEHEQQRFLTWARKAIKGEAAA